MNEKLKILNMYEIRAVSKDGQGYLVELCCDESNINESFQQHIHKIGWSQYKYKITAWKPVKSKHIEIDYDSNN